MRAVVFGLLIIIIGQYEVSGKDGEVDDHNLRSPTNSDSISMTDEQREWLDTFTTCMSAVNKDTPPLANMSGRDVAGYCSLMRFDALRCLSGKMAIETDSGSVADRGSVLIELLKKTRPVEEDPSELIRHVRLYHIACLYHDWAEWQYEPCFRDMFDRCVRKDGDCREEACQVRQQFASDPKDPDANHTTHHGANTLAANALMIILAYVITAD